MLVSAVTLESALLEHVKTKNAYVVLFYDLLETSIVKLCKLRKVMHVCDYIAEVLLQKQKVFFRRRFDMSALCFIPVCSIGATDDILDLLLRCRNPAYNVIAFNTLKGENFV